MVGLVAQLLEMVVQVLNSNHFLFNFTLLGGNGGKGGFGGKGGDGIQGPSIALLVSCFRLPIIYSFSQARGNGKPSSKFLTLSVSSGKGQGIRELCYDGLKSFSCESFCVYFQKFSFHSHTVGKSECVHDSTMNAIHDSPNVVMKEASTTQKEFIPTEVKVLSACSAVMSAVIVYIVASYVDKAYKGLENRRMGIT